VAATLDSQKISTTRGDHERRCHVTRAAPHRAQPDDRGGHPGFFLVYNDRRDTSELTSDELLGRSFILKYTRLLDF
jgi:hypothetical protein